MIKERNKDLEQHIETVRTTINDVSIEDEGFKAVHKQLNTSKQQMSLRR